MVSACKEALFNPSSLNFPDKLSSFSNFHQHWKGPPLSPWWSPSGLQSVLSSFSKCCKCSVSCGIICSKDTIITPQDWMLSRDMQILLRTIHLMMISCLVPQSYYLLPQILSNYCSSNTIQKAPKKQKIQKNTYRFWFLKPVEPTEMRVFPSYLLLFSLHPIHT